MYYSYVEIECKATSFSPARTKLAVKLLNPGLYGRTFAGIWIAGVAFLWHMVVVTLARGGIHKKISALEKIAKKVPRVFFSKLVFGDLHKS
jgi:hypothetical protein